MFKRFLVTLGILAGLFSPVHAAGTIPYSLSQQLDQYGKPLAGCLFYSIQAGTTSTPQNAYQDSALTIALPNPQTCDAAGRLPQMFFADGTIKVRLTDKNGITQVVADNIQVVGASSGSGGGGSVDATTVLATGDVKVRYGTGSLSGFVRANGRTIGSATSGASERANADTQALFEYLWGADSTLTVSGGRGASANADWTANKTITLPDARGRVIAGLDGMGNSQAGRLGSGAGSFGVNNDTLGAAGGGEVHTLVTANLPPYTPSGTNGNISVDASGNRVLTTNGVISGSTFGSGAFSTVPTTNSSWSSVTSLTGSAPSWTGTAQGGTSAAFDTMSPAILMTMYIKL